MPNARLDEIAPLERLRQATLLVAGAHDVEGALQAIADAAREMTGAQFSALGVPGEPGQPMAYFFYSGVSDDAVRALGAPPTGHGVLGELLSGDQPIRERNILEHPAAKGYPRGHPPIESFLGMPIRAGGQVIGDLYLGNKLGAESFTAEDEHLVGLLATHAAVVIQSLRFQEQSHQVAALAERERIAQQIQDDVLQAMYGCGLMLRNLNLGDPAQAEDMLKQAQTHLESAIDHLRANLLGLTHSRPPAQ